jgi:hypothetical protein
MGKDPDLQRDAKDSFFASDMYLPYPAIAIWLSPRSRGVWDLYDCQDQVALAGYDCRKETFQFS